MDKSQKLTMGALKQLGFQMALATKKNKEEFSKLKHNCGHRKPGYTSDARLCEEIKQTWGIDLPCQFVSCPLLYRGIL